MGKGNSKKVFYENFVKIGLPLVIQQFLLSSLNFVDNLMIGRLGTEYIAALGFSNQVYKVLDLFMFGAYGGMGVFIAQYHGKNNYEIIKKIFGGMLIVGLLLSSIFMLISLFFTEEIIKLFSKDKKVIEIGVSYLFITSFSFVASAITFAYSFALRSMGKTKLPMYVSIIGILINTGLNYILIYGKLGFSPLNEKGAAIATVIARVIQLITIIYLISVYDYGLKAKLKKYLGLPKELIKEMTKVCTPIFFTEVFWILGTMSLSIAYAKLGTKQAASIQIADIMFSIAAIFFMGVSNAASVMIGNTIGSGKNKLAIIHSKRVLKVAFILSLLSVIIIQILTIPILKMYSLTPEVFQMAKVTIRVFGIAIFFKLINWTVLIGILRAGGDTKIAFCLDTFPMYFYAVPVAFLCAKLNIPIYYSVALVNIEEIIKFVLALKRYSTMKWLKDITV